MSDLVALSMTAEAQMIANGVAPALAKATVSQAFNWSISIANKVSPEIREQVARELFVKCIRKPKYITAMRRAFVPGAETEEFPTES